MKVCLELLGAVTGVVVECRLTVPVVSDSEIALSTREQRLLD